MFVITELSSAAINCHTVVQKVKVAINQMLTDLPVYLLFCATKRQKFKANLGLRRFAQQFSDTLHHRTEVQPEFNRIVSPGRRTRNCGLQKQSTCYVIEFQVHLELATEIYFHRETAILFVLLRNNLESQSIIR